MFLIDDLFLEITVSIIIAILSFVLGVLAKRIVQWRNNYIIRSILRNKYTIVLSAHSQFREFEASGLVGKGDIMALLELQKLISSKARENGEIVFCSSSDESFDLRKDLILLGGPGVNPLTKKMLKVITTSLQYRAFGHPVLFIYDVERATNYTPSSPKKDILTDKGYIMKANNPFCPTAKVLILFGGYGYGTWGAVQCLFSKEFRKRIKKAHCGSFEAVLDISVMQKRPQKSTIIKLREFD